ncbi:hypothetical protein K0M31_007451 [Melipona bicolor]|uniref:Odorant-binding protein n=1 Tax=Melipona bicolor TaxID=60889 RepID=A0AA40KVT3_9HYME|nr:hypothetical protein K0M31_007451 [Melipona bicolor]
MEVRNAVWLVEEGSCVPKSSSISLRLVEENTESMRIAVILFCILYFACTQCGAKPSRADESGIITCIPDMGKEFDKDMFLLNNETTEENELNGCRLACILEKKDMMVDNKFQTSVIEEYIAEVFDDDENEKEIMLQHTHHCIDQAENDDKCVAARQFVDCTKEQLDLRNVILYSLFFEALAIHLEGIGNFLNFTSKLN